MSLRATGPTVLEAAALFSRTARHLRPCQFAYLAARPLRRTAGHVRARGGSDWPLAADRIDALRHALCRDSSHTTHAAVRHADAVLAGEFHYLGETRRLHGIDWGSRYGTPLWSFHLQYGQFVEHLAQAHEQTGDPKYLAGLTQLVDSWILNRKPAGSDAWAPYAVARRLVHWTRAFLRCSRQLTPSFRERWLSSIARQTRYLTWNVEWHLLGNHVQKNLHGIYCASALFSGRLPARLRAWSAVLLAQQLREQVLDDGMHFERSPMYHRLVLADYREAAAVAGVVGGPHPVRDGDALDRMTAALRRFVRSDGSLHLFNDAANDAEAPLPLSSAAALPAAPCCWSLPAAGYYGRSSSRYSFIVDCGEPGPPYQAAHGHCDLLSFELDLDGAPFIVDSGTSGYDDDPLRAYVRSTRAHNTVQLAELEQHEVWGTFRVARRARIREARLDAEAGRFVGAYSPYAAPDAVHERVVELRERHVRISDRVAGVHGGAVRSFLHFHPDVSIATEGGTVHASTGRRSALIETHNIAGMRIIKGADDPVQGWYAPAFGLRIPAPVVEFVVSDAAEPFGYTITF